MDPAHTVGQAQFGEQVGRGAALSRPADDDQFYIPFGS